MDEQELYRLYALALRLIPDEDAAGDLFMESRTESHLRLRASRWLDARGLNVDESRPAPTLDRAQMEYALHLARRGRIKRQIRTVLAGLGGMVAAAAVVVLLLFFKPAPDALASDPAFKRDPLDTEAAPSGLTAHVYRAEATPGNVTVWWALSGSGAAKLGESLTPMLAVNGMTDPLLPPSETSLGRPGKDLLLGRSTYNATVSRGGRELTVGLSMYGSRRQGLMTVPVTLTGHDPDARVQTVAAPFTSSLEGFSVEQVVRSPRNTDDFVPV